MIELLVALALGIALGVLAGLAPGLHPNTLVPMLVGVAAYFNPLTAAVALVAVGVTNSFVSFIPAILLGAPEEAESMGTLPGHRMLLAGRGYEAIRLTVIGGLGGIILGLAALPLMWMGFPIVYSAIRPLLHWILSAVVAYMVLSERDLSGIGWASLTFATSGLLGVITLDGLGNSMLFPLLTGLFGIPMSLLSLRNGVKLPETVSYEIQPMSDKEQLKGIGIGTVGGILVGLLPGIGASQAAVLAQEATGRSDSQESAQRTFLIALGGVTAADMIYSMLALWLVGNPRSGISVAVEQLVSTTPETLLMVLAAVVASAGIAAYLTLKLARSILPLLRRIDYSRLNLLIVALLVLSVFFLTGPLGLLILTVSTAIGLIPNLTGIRRSHAMGCLLLPTILFFAGI